MKNILTLEQMNLLNELVEAHGLDKSQIAFEGEDLTPIFDYEAVNYLSLKLTDIKSIRTTVDRLNSDHAKAVCEVELEDGRTRSIEESAYLGEAIGDGETIGSLRLAEQVAQARAARRGIRSVGVNLYHAHRKFMETGEIAVSHVNHDPRYPQYQEINVLAHKLGLKSSATLGGRRVEERTEYDRLLALNFDGRTSAKDLNDVELQRLKIMLRSFARLSNPIAAADKSAA